MPKHLLLLFLFLLSLTLCPVRAGAEDAISQSSSTLSFFPLTSPDSYPGSVFRLIPVANNHPLGGAHPGLTRVIIGIHDQSRNAAGMLALLSTLAGPANDKVLILAPQFMAPDDPQRFYVDVPEALRNNFVIWPLDAWEDGSASQAEAPQIGISSFTALDIIIAYFGEKRMFPDLKEIIVAGHGGGGDFVHRYAAMSGTVEAMEKQGISVRFLVANASTYLYLTPARPKVSSFGFATPNAASCLNYNFYRYGLDYLNAYGRQTGANAIKTKYGDRYVTYLVGENAGTADPYPDDSCSAMFEGANRTARGVSYGMYLSQLFSDTIEGKQKTIVIPQVAYDPVAMLGSPCGLSVLFGDGKCAVPASALK